MAEVCLYEADNYELDKLDDILNPSYKSNYNPNGREIREALKTSSFSFTIEDVSRVLTHIICESDDSYTQQSQRYVVIAKDGYVTPEEIRDTEFEERFTELLDKTLRLYNEMTPLKPESENKKGRKTHADYLYGIHIEDGRYIIPLAAKSNIMVTINGSEMLNFLETLKTSDTKEAEQIYNDVLGKIEQKNLREYLREQTKDTKPSEFAYQTRKYLFDGIDPVEILGIADLPELRAAIGALTSTEERKPSEISEEWIENLDIGMKKAKKLVGRVLGYGHDSIAEHATFTIGYIMSWTCYHQYERHRINKNIRQPFNESAEMYQHATMDSITNSKFAEEYAELVDEVHEFRKEIAAAGLDEAVPYLLLNGDLMKVVTNTNARNLVHVLKTRTCNNAQQEIRGIAQYLAKELRGMWLPLFQKAAPPCINDKCPEGKMACGNPPKPEDWYAETIKDKETKNKG